MSDYTDTLAQSFDARREIFQRGFSLALCSHDPERGYLPTVDVDTGWCLSEISPEDPTAAIEPGVGQEKVQIVESNSITALMLRNCAALLIQRTEEEDPRIFKIVTRDEPLRGNVRNWTLFVTDTGETNL